MRKFQFPISLPCPNWCRQLAPRLYVRGWPTYAWGELGVLAVASLLALRGGAVLLQASLDIDKRVAGDTDGAWLWFVLALALYGGWVWGTRGKTAIWRGAHPSFHFTPPQPVTVSHVLAIKRRWVKPLTLLALAVLGTILAYRWNVIRDKHGAVVEIELTARGALAWVLSVVFWAWLLGADWRGALNWARGWRGWLRWRAWDYTSWILWGMVALGALLRFWQFADVPPEMTSDHIEKLLDAWRVREGYHAVFFYNNGGREAFQMYLVALLAELGVGYTFTALKLATVL